MRKRLIFCGVLVAALLAAIIGGSAVGQPPDNGQDFAVDRILVKFRSDLPENAKAAIHARQGGRVIETIPGIEVQVIRVPENRAREKVRAYASEAGVVFAEPDYVARAIFAANDPYVGNQWAVSKIQAPQAWDVTQGSSQVRIAICDTGIDQDHEDLASKIVASRNFTTSTTLDDKYGHGTHVAGSAAATTNNAKGVAGIGFNSSLMNAKVLSDSGIGYHSWIASGIIWAADNSAKVINLSLGGSSSSTTLENAVNYAWNKGSVVVAAAGNSNTSSPSYPAYYTNAIAVAATDSSDRKASFSNYGSWVDVAAPGVSIFSTLPNHTNTIGTLNYGYLSGTSMATPHVAGLAGLVFAVTPGATNIQVREKIEGSLDPTTGFTTAIGRINVYKAVASQAPPVFPIKQTAGTINVIDNAQKTITLNTTVFNFNDGTMFVLRGVNTLQSGQQATIYYRDQADGTRLIEWVLVGASLADLRNELKELDGF